MGPTQVAQAGMGAGVGGTLLSAFGALTSGNAQASQYSYQAGIAQMQKKVALQNRDYVLAAGETEAAQYGLKTKNIAGKIVAGQGASGIDIGGASSVAVRQGQQLITDMDMAQIRNNTARKAYGYTVEAATDQAQSDMYSAAASNVKKAIPFNIAASLLSGTSSVASKWLQYKSTFPQGGGGGSNIGGSVDY